MTETVTQTILDKTVPIPKRLIRSTSLSNQDKMVFGALAYLAGIHSSNDIPAQCYVTEADIAGVLGTHKRGISTSLSRLRDSRNIEWSVEMTHAGWGYKVKLLWD